MQRQQQQRTKYNLPKSYLDLRQEKEAARSEPAKKPHVLLDERRSRPQQPQRPPPRSVSNERRSEQQHRKPQRLDRGRRDPRERAAVAQPVQQAQPVPQPAVFDLMAHYQRQFAPAFLLQTPQPRQPLLLGDVSSLLESVRRVQREEPVETVAQQLERNRARQNEIREALAACRSGAGEQYDPLQEPAVAPQEQHLERIRARQKEIREALDAAQCGAREEYDPLQWSGQDDDDEATESVKKREEADLASYLASLKTRYAPIKKLRTTEHSSSS